VSRPTKPRTLKVVILEEDIDNAMAARRKVGYEASMSCPIAQAVMRTYPRKYTIVWVGGDALYRSNSDFMYEHDGQQIITSFDMGLQGTKNIRQLVGTIVTIRPTLDKVSTNMLMVMKKHENTSGN